MTDLAHKTTRLFLVALLSTAPLAVIAQESGSPAQSVEADPDEEAEAGDTVDQGSLENTATATEQGEDAEIKLKEDQDAEDGSLVEDDAKSDG